MAAITTTEQFLRSSPTRVVHGPSRFSAASPVRLTVILTHWLSIRAAIYTGSQPITLQDGRRSSNSLQITELGQNLFFTFSGRSSFPAMLPTLWQQRRTARCMALFPAIRIFTVAPCSQSHPRLVRAGGRWAWFTTSTQGRFRSRMASPLRPMATYMERQLTLTAMYMNSRQAVNSSAPENLWANALIDVRNLRSHRTPKQHRNILPHFADQHGLCLRAKSRLADGPIHALQLIHQDGSLHLVNRNGQGE